MSAVANECTLSRRDQSSQPQRRIGGQELKISETLIDAGPQEKKMIWKEKRRSQRLALSVPVVAYRSQKLGLPFSEGTRTLMVSAHGALISLDAKVVADQRLVLKHALSGEEQECRVVFTEKKLTGPTEVGIEFRQPAPNFWHIAFPPSDWTAPAPELTTLDSR
jgi:hypothetical protein